MPQQKENGGGCTHLRGIVLKVGGAAMHVDTKARRGVREPGLRLSGVLKVEPL